MQVERKGCPDKRMTEEMVRAAESEVARSRAGLIDHRAEAIRDHDARPLTEHLDEWRASMLAKGRTDKHAELSYNRALRVVELAKAARLSDLQPSRIQAALASLKKAGKSLETCNHHRACIRAFARWARDDGRMQYDPMAGVTGFNAREDVRHARRSLPSDELSKLIQAAQDGPPIFGMDGPDRAMAYRLAFGTGFRVNELRSLTPANFRLKGDRPCVVLKAGDAKDRRKVEQPISAELAADLLPWLAGKPSGRPVLPLHHETAKMIRRDLEAAGIAYETEDGFADFHSLRASYVSALVASGADIKTVQTLARHKKPVTTLNHYAKSNPEDIHGTVRSLPTPPAAPRGPPRRLPPSRANL